MLASVDLESAKKRLELITQEMAAIKASGEVAAPKTWIAKYAVPRKGKKYYYYRLMEARERKSKSGKIQGQTKLYLGNSESELYLHHRAAIERRQQLKSLEREYNKLKKKYGTAKESGLIEHSEELSSAESVEVKADLKGERENNQELVKAIEKLELGQEQILDVLKALAEKVGVEVSLKIYK